MAKTFTEEDLPALAAQLRKPEGDMGLEVARMMNTGNGPMNLHTLAVVNPQPEDAILEVGMGNGMFVKNILNQHPSITYMGCDYSELMVQEACGHNSDFIEAGRAGFICGTIASLPFEDASFTKVFTINTMYFWENPEAVLQELKRVLKAGARLVIAIRPENNMLKLPVSRYNFTLYNRQQVEDMLHSAGYNDIEVTEIKEPRQERWGQSMERETLILACTKP